MKLSRPIVCSGRDIAPPPRNWTPRRESDNEMKIKSGLHYSWKGHIQFWLSLSPSPTPTTPIPNRQSSQLDLDSLCTLSINFRVTTSRRPPCLSKFAYPLRSSVRTYVVRQGVYEDLRPPPPVFNSIGPFLPPLSIHHYTRQVYLSRWNFTMKRLMAAAA